MTTYYNAEFAAEYIVKRDPDGNWCEWNESTTDYDSLITGLNGVVYCMAEGPDGKIYVGGLFTDAGGDTDADYLARWNPISETWEKVIAGLNNRVSSLDFDANGDLYIAGQFTNLKTAYGDYVAKITDLDGTPTVNVLNTAINIPNGPVQTIKVGTDGCVYIGGGFTSTGPASTGRISKHDGSEWVAVGTGFSDGAVATLAFAPNGDLYIGGTFTNADGTNGDYLCYWDGSSFNRVGTVELNGQLISIDFDAQARLIVGGVFTNAGGVSGADYIARWNGASWESLGTGTNGYVWRIFSIDNKIYVAGEFTAAGGITLTDRVAVWSNGAWQPLDIDLPGTATVYSILPASDGSLYIGGSFSTVGEDPYEDAVCGLSYEVEVAEEIEESVDEDDIDPIDNTGV